MRYISPCLKVGIVLGGLTLAGCSGEPSPAAADSAIGWISPYLTDDVETVVLVDTKKLGPLWPMAEGLLRLTTSDKVPDLSTVDMAALVIMPQPPSSSRQPNWAVLLGSKEPFSSEQKQDLMDLARGMLGLPKDDRDLEKYLARFDPPIPQQMAPKLVANGNTTILGWTSAVDALHAKTDSGSRIAKALEIQGEHAVNAYAEIREQELRRLDTRIVRLTGGVRDLSNSSRALGIQFLEILGKSRSVALAIDLSPNLSASFRVTPNSPEDSANMRDQWQPLLDWFQGHVREVQAAAEKRGELSLLFANVLARAANEGRLTDSDGVVQLEWKSSPKFANEFMASAIAEATAAARRAMHLAVRESNLKQLGQGLLQFVNHNQERLPWNIRSAEGKTLMSWRVALLPMLGEKAIYDQLRMDEVWDSPHNLALIRQVNPRLFAANSHTPDGRADMLAVMGTRLGFSPNEWRKGRGVVTISSVTDGMAYTGFVVEVDPAKSVPWARPVDYTFDPAQPTAGLGSAEDSFFHLVFGDARVKRVSKDESAETLKRVFNRGDAVPYDLKEVRD